MDTHHARMLFGKFYKERITRVPYSYLLWAVSADCDGEVELENGKTVKASVAAKAEMERRGERLPDICVSMHAVDRFSVKHFALYGIYKKRGEGIYTFLERIADKLVKANPGQKRYRWNGCTFVVEHDGAIPTVLTVR